MYLELRNLVAQKRERGNEGYVEDPKLGAAERQKESLYKYLLYINMSEKKMDLYQT